MNLSISLVRVKFANIIRFKITPVEILRISKQNIRFLESSIYSHENFLEF